MQEEEERHFVPRPPSGGSTTDFIVTVFALMVVAIMLIMTVAVVIAGLQGKDVKGLFNVITDITTTVIGALVGYMAGRGAMQRQQQGRD